MAASSSRQARNFATTRWSMVVAAGRTNSPEAKNALAELCESYWHPLYAFIRTRGYPREEARDLTQSFILHLLEKQTIQVADPARGRFRSFLLGCLKNFLSHERDKQQTKKRGGSKLAFKMYLFEGEKCFQPVAKESTPEAVFDRVWMNSVLKHVCDRLLEPFKKQGKLVYYTRLMFGIYGSDYVNYDSIALEFGMTPAAVRQAVSRLRRRYKELLVEEIAHTVSDPNEIEDEIRQLFAIAAGK